MTDRPSRLMIWCAARGGMRSVVEAYDRDGFLQSQNVGLIASYVDGGVARRQAVLARALAQFTLALARRRIELVHCHAAMRGSFWRKGLFASIARRFGVPVLLHLHGSEMKPFYQSLPAPLKAMVRAHLTAADEVLVLSNSWRDFVSSIAPNARITVLPNYVAVPALPDPAARRPGEILFLGLVGDRKGVFDLIPAFAEVRARHPGAHLTIAGNGEVARAAAAISAAGLGDGAVTLAGWRDGAAKEELLASAPIYVLPSHNEGLPMSVLEAMAHGLAVVTSRVGGIPELITDGVHGLLVDAGDRAGLAAALSRLLSDDDLRARIAAAGRERVTARYSAAAVLPQLSAIYARHASAPPGATPAA